MAVGPASAALRHPSAGGLDPVSVARSLWSLRSLRSLRPRLGRTRALMAGGPPPLRFGTLPLAALIRSRWLARFSRFAPSALCALAGAALCPMAVGPASAALRHPSAGPLSGLGGSLHSLAGARSFLCALAGAALFLLECVRFLRSGLSGCTHCPRAVGPAWPRLSTCVPTPLW